MRSLLGKPLQPPFAHAVSRAEGSPSGGAGSFTVESLGRELRAVLPPLRLHSVSVYDDQGNVLWLSEGALGPDEHALVADALETFGGQDRSNGCERKLEDGRSAAFLPMRSAQENLVGLVMVLTEFKAVGEGWIDRVLTAPVRAILQKLAGLLRPAATPQAQAEAAPLTLSIAEDPTPATATDEPSIRSRTLDPKTVQAMLEAEGLTLELDSAPPPAAPAAPRVESRSVSAAASPRESSAPPSEAGVTLEVLPFVKLRAGGRMRRFEVLPRGTARQNRDPAVLDVMAVEQLLVWLGTHRAAWTQEPTCFTLNLSIATLEDDRFLQRLSAQLADSGISADTLGFEIAEPLCTQRRAQVERFIGGCERLGCFVVIDGFSFDSAVVPMLRSTAVRLVKMDSRLTATVMKDKLSQALVVAIVQAVKVLGIHCAAQQVDSQSAVRWLTAVGCDFVQGPILARPIPIDRLAQSSVG